MELTSYLILAVIATILIRRDLKKRAENKKMLEQLEFEFDRNN